MPEYQADDQLVCERCMRQYRYGAAVPQKVNSVAADRDEIPESYLVGCPFCNAAVGGYGVPLALAKQWGWV